MEGDLNNNPTEKLDEAIVLVEKEELVENYNEIIDILKRYCDLDERYYPLLSLWCLACANHKSFMSFPYIFLNAMKGSGKSRLLSLMAYLCNGTVLNSLTEAVLFRSQEMLAIDEFEGVNRKGYENLKELLNSAYKKGAKVRRMRKTFSKDGENQVVEQFDVYRPIMIANISGGESVLEDRCLFLILEKSDNVRIVNKAEIWEHEPKAKKIREFLSKPCRVCHVGWVYSMYIGWNLYLESRLDILDIHNIHNTNDTNDILDIEGRTFYDKIYESGIVGRNFELTFPLLFIANILGQEIYDNILNILKEIVKEKKEEDFAESKDVSLIEYISQLPQDDKWISLKDLMQSYRNFIGTDDPWTNEIWLGQALRRLKLFKEKKRKTNGRYYMLDIPKAQEKIKIFK